MATCPICASATTDQRWSYQHYRIIACPRCDLQFADPLRGAPLDYYQSRYAAIVTATLANSVHPGMRYTLDAIRRAARQYLPADRRRLIDVGCGPGQVLAALRHDGFDGYGIDFNPDVVQVAREYFGLAADVQRVEELIALDRHFDLALLIHVLEHVDQPAALLRDVGQLLAPGGLLVVDLPNRKRFTARRSLERGDFGEGEYPPHHLTFWSTTALANALTAAGYQVLECRPRPLGDHGQIEQFLRNRLRLPDGRPTALLGQGFGRLASRLRLQGDSILAIARR